MTKRMKMGYVEVEMQPACNLFAAGVRARGHVYHFSEIVQVRSSHHLRVSSFLNQTKPHPRVDWHEGCVIAPSPGYFCSNLDRLAQLVPCPTHCIIMMSSSVCSTLPSLHLAGAGGWGPRRNVCSGRACN